METLVSQKISLKQIFQDHWKSLLQTNKSLVTWYVAYNIWKIINCREPDGLGINDFQMKLFVRFIK